MSTLTQKTVERVLRGEVLPSIIAAREKPPHWWRRLRSVHFYGTELASALAGWGIASPFVDYASGRAQTFVMEAAGIGSFVLALSWLALVSYLKGAEIPAKLDRYDALSTTFTALDQQLHDILCTEFPTESLTMFKSRILDAREMHKDAFMVAVSDANIRTKAKNEAAVLVDDYKACWNEKLGGASIQALPGEK